MSRMTRLLLYTQNHEPGGGNRYFTDFIQAAASSVQMDIVTNRGGLFEHDRQRINTCGISVSELDILCTHDLIRHKNSATRYLCRLALRLPLVRHVFARTLSRINRNRFTAYLRHRHYDTVIAFNGGYPAAWSCFDLLSVAADRGMHTVMSVVSMPAPYGTADRVYRKVVPRINGFIVNCAAIRNALSASRRIAEQKIEVIYNCTALPECIHSYESIGRRDLRFGFVGRVEALKGAEMLAEAFAKVLQDTTGIRLDFYGKNRLSRQTEVLIRQSNGKMTLHGMFGDPDKEVYPYIDVLILPSFWEGFPYVVIEAMAHGIPVIATDVGGVSEVVQNRQTGLLIRAREAESLQQAIQWMATNPEMLSEYGRNARKLTEEHFSYDVFLARVKRYLSDSLPIKSETPSLQNKIK